MISKYASALVGIIALGCAGSASAGTGKQLLALSPSQQASYLAQVISAVAQSFQTTDGATVRSNCVNRWYNQDIQAANADILRNAAKFSDEDPVRVAMALMAKQCGRDKAEGMQILHDRVAGKVELTDEAARRAQANAQREQSAAEAELKAAQARAWRLPDGRRIYPDSNGNWRFENGAAVPHALAQTRVPPR